MSVRRGISAEMKVTEGCLYALSESLVQQTKSLRAEGQSVVVVRLCKNFCNAMRGHCVGGDRTCPPGERSVRIRKYNFVSGKAAFAAAAIFVLPPEGPFFATFLKSSGAFSNDKKSKGVEATAL
jgi:hypothetical protein